MRFRRLCPTFLLLAHVAITPALAASAVHPSCITAYDDARAGKLAEAAARMAECGASVDKPTPAHTVVLYDRARVLDQLGRHDEALAQLVALTDKPHFETGLADEFSGPGAWSRDPEKTRARQATGINRADLLLDIAYRKLQANDPRSAMDWAERSARHALTRFRPEGEFMPMDRDVGCALAVRGYARAKVEKDQTNAAVDILRAHVRGCEKLPVAAIAADQPEEVRKQLADLKQRFDALQAEAGKATATARQKRHEAAAKPADASYSALAFGMLGGALETQKAIDPVLKQRTGFLAAEAGVLGAEPLFDSPAKP